MFEPQEIRELSITTDGTGAQQGDSLSSIEKHKVYMSELSKDVGLDSFAQFVFLQHFVFGFDKSRHLLFWDQRALEQALYVSFGVAVKAAQRAHDLRREADRSDSRARNFNWQASELRKKLENLKSAVAMEQDAATEAEDLRELHRDLSRRRDAREAAVSKLRSSMSDVELSMATASARHAALRAEYEAEYTKRLRSKADVSKHPIVAAVLSGEACGLCGSTELSSFQKRDAA